MEIIDFHTHPFINFETNICAHRDWFNVDAKTSLQYIKGLGISKICGSVISTEDANKVGFDITRNRNNTMLDLKKEYGDFYIPGFHVHPSYLRESLEEIERMHKLGINLIGELVPYMYGWDDYTSKEFYEILDLAENYNMVVNIHPILDEDKMDKLVRDHKNIVFVAAHPGELKQLKRHIERMKMSDNYHLDLSGTGLFRHAMLRRCIDECGVEKFVFGSDYPTCNPAMFIGGVVMDSLLTDAEKEAILSGNAKRILKLK